MVKNLKIDPKRITMYGAALLIVLIFIMLLTLWPKSFAYSECGQCEMLGVNANIERIEGIVFGPSGMQIKAIVNTTCYQRISADHEFENGTIKLMVKPIGEAISNHCLCDREITFNLPNYAKAKSIELYYSGKLLDKRSIIANTLSDGAEFCDSDVRYRQICYYRLAFMKKDPSFCKKTVDEKACKRELEEFLTLKCLSFHNEKYCNNIFVKSRSNQKK